ncbi:hypothetical protein DFP72DRAFT_931740 [Ephemerocybe angulata]|uniref:F-box domain-containing protein n=1 Tax=Ephemerocybe angulata TaxID=980116 RepID=A0A8H6HCN9_9AGAR|nr:hypothetical protein DFP72DRAFT_931740 [Tulosesus angulatus]
MLSLLDLPTEILLQIVEHACAPSDCVTVYALCRTSKELWHLSRGHRFTSAQVVGWKALLALEELYSSLPESSEERRKGIVNLFVDLPCLFQAAYPEGPIWCNEDDSDDGCYVFRKDYDLVTTGEEDEGYLSEGDLVELEMVEKVVPGTGRRHTILGDRCRLYEAEGDVERGYDQDGAYIEGTHSDSEGYEGDSDPDTEERFDESELEYRAVSPSMISELWAELKDLANDAKGAPIPSLASNTQQGHHLPRDLGLLPSEESDDDASYAPSELVSDRDQRAYTMTMDQVYRTIEAKVHSAEFSTTDESVLWDSEDELEYASLAISESEAQYVAGTQVSTEEWDSGPELHGYGDNEPLDLTFLEQEHRSRSSRMAFTVYSALYRLLEANGETMEVLTLHWKPLHDLHLCRIFPILPKLRSLTLCRHESTDYSIGIAPGPDNLQDVQDKLFPSLERLDHDCLMLSNWTSRYRALILKLHTFVYFTVSCNWIRHTLDFTHHSPLPSSVKVIRIHCTCEDSENARPNCRETVMTYLANIVDIVIVHSVDIKQEWLDQLESPVSFRLPFQRRQT